MRAIIFGINAGQLFVDCPFQVDSIGAGFSNNTNFYRRVKNSFAIFTQTHSVKSLLQRYTFASGWVNACFKWIQYFSCFNPSCAAYIFGNLISNIY